MRRLLLSVVPPLAVTMVVPVLGVAACSGGDDAPAANRDIELTGELPISVARPDRPGVSSAISGTERARLIGGAATEPGAPGGYRYVGFPFLVTVQGGRPTAVHQLWAP